MRRKQTVRREIIKDSRRIGSKSLSDSVRAWASLLFLHTANVYPGDNFYCSSFRASTA